MPFFPERTDYTVRPASLEDMAGTSMLLEASYGRLMASSYDADLLERVLPLISRANPKLLTSGTYYVAESGSREIIGCGGWTRDRPDTENVEDMVGHVRHFATHPDWTGRGIGRAIHDRSRRQAVEAGITRFICYASLNAVPFYAALGFRAIRRIDVPIAADIGFPAMLMERELLATDESRG